MHKSVRKNKKTLHVIIWYQLRLICGQGLKSAYQFLKRDVNDSLNNSNVDVCIIGLLITVAAWHVF